jgi:hypothetical protein
MNDAQQPGKGAAASSEAYEGFTAEERDAMKQRAKELKAAAERGRARSAGAGQAERGGKQADAEPEVLAKLAEMPDTDRVLGERVHAIIKASAPDLTPRLWYGMPAYARGTKIVCHFQPAQKFKTRYATLNFSDGANLDDGTMWPVAFALTELTAADEARIGALVRQALS